MTDFAQAVSEDLWDEMETRLATLLEYGNMARMPVSEPLGDGLFALRANVDTVQGRLIYFFGTERRQIVFVHSITAKKQRRIPQEILDESQRRRMAVVAEVSLIHEFRLDRPH